MQGADFGVGSSRGLSNYDARGKVISFLAASSNLGDIVKAVPLLLVIALILSGCVFSDPYMKDVMTRTSTASSLKDADEQIRIGYMARYLAKTNTRAQLESRVLKTSYVRQWDAIDSSTTASMATDLIVGQVGSNLGGAVGGAFLALELLGGDGSMRYVSQAFLPETLGEKQLDTEEAAHDALVEMMDARLMSVADKLGADIECKHGCESAHRVYRITLDELKLGAQYKYLPKEIFASLNVRRPVKVEASDPISALVGFPVAWQTPPGDTASFRLQDELVMLAKPEDADVIVETESGWVLPSARRPTDHSTIGVQIIATIYNSPYLLWGSSRNSPSIIFYDGQAYGYISNGRPDFVSRLLDVAPLDL